MNKNDVIEKYGNCDLYFYHDSSENTRAIKARRHAVKCNVFVSSQALQYVKSHGFDQNVQACHVGRAGDNTIIIKIDDCMVAIFPPMSDVVVFDLSKNNDNWERLGTGKSYQEKLSLVNNCKPVASDVRLSGGTPETIKNRIVQLSYR